MKTARLVVCALLFASLAWGDDGHHHELSEQELGSVHFATSCSPSVEKDFNRAVALLHSFQYEQTREAFEVARQRFGLYLFFEIGRRIGGECFLSYVCVRLDEDSRKSAMGERLGGVQFIVDLTAHNRTHLIGEDSPRKQVGVAAPQLSRA